MANKYAAKGVSIDDLANDSAVMKDMTENTLFDPKNPELGTMKENGFECVGFNPGANGAGKATFEKRDAQGNLQERREMQHLAAQPVSADKDGKPLTNGMVAGAPSKSMYTGDVSRMQISSRRLVIQALLLLVKTRMVSLLTRAFVLLAPKMLMALSLSR